MDNRTMREIFNDGIFTDNTVFKLAISLCPTIAVTNSLKNGFFLGFATGRVQLPSTILIPIYLSQYAIGSMPVFEFALLYFAVFMGYISTPIHPCVAYSLKYFKTESPARQLAERFTNLIPRFHFLI